MYVHEATGLIYLANPRTASRATAKALQGIGFEMVGSHHSGPQSHPDYDLLDRRIIHVSRPVTTFTAVRHLADTIQSWARHLRIPPSPKVVWDVLARLDSGNQRGIIPGWPSYTLFPHAQHADWLLRYHCLEDDLNRVLQDHGLGPVTLEWVDD